MRLLPLLALAASLAACGRPRPNVLLLVMDTTRGDRVSVNGYARPTTPHLAELAKTGVTFRDAWAPCCWTAPSHASLFTGLRPEHHGLTEGNRRYLDPGAVTLAERFQGKGWQTGCFTNNPNLSPAWGLVQGFDHVEAFWEKPDRPYPWAPQTHRRALQWALDARAKGDPFFLFVNDMEPHLPYTPPPETAKRFLRETATEAELAEARAFDFPLNVGFLLGRTPVPPRKTALLSDLYDAEIAEVDAALPILLEGLKSAGLLDDTIVVITSDHGESLGEHRRFGHQFGMWRQTLHVPLVIRYPGRFDGGRAADDLVRLEDVPPTLLELCGLDPLANIDGASLTGGLGGRVARGVIGTSDRYVEEMSKAYPGADLAPVTRGVHSLREGRFHYLRDDEGGEELYDVVADPAETHDLAPKGGADLVRLRKLLEE